MVLLLLLNIFATRRLRPGAKFEFCCSKSRHLQGCRMNVRGCNDILDSLYFTISTRCSRECTTVCFFSIHKPSFFSIAHIESILIAAVTTENIFRKYFYVQCCTSTSVLLIRFVVVIISFTWHDCKLQIYIHRLAICIANFY